MPVTTEPTCCRASLISVESELCPNHDAHCSWLPAMLRWAAHRLSIHTEHILLGSMRSPALKRSSPLCRHWMREDPDAVMRGVWQALLPGGRFIADCGGAGNVLSVGAVCMEMPAVGSCAFPDAGLLNRTDISC